mgnify:CR=1 FL=1
MTNFINFKKLYNNDQIFNIFITQCDDITQSIHSIKKFNEKEIIFINNITKDITNKYNIVNNIKLKHSLINSIISELKLYFNINEYNFNDFSFDFIDCLISLNNNLKYLVEKEAN